MWPLWVNETQTPTVYYGSEIPQHKHTTSLEAVVRIQASVHTWEPAAWTQQGNNLLFIFYCYSKLQTVGIVCDLLNREKESDFVVRALISKSASLIWRDMWGKRGWGIPWINKQPTLGFGKCEILKLLLVYLVTLTSIFWTYLGIKTWVKKRKQEECLGRGIPTWLFILLHVNYFYYHDMKEYLILLKTNYWSQPALAHVASRQFSHVFLTFSKHSISPTMQKELLVVLSGHGSQQTSPGVCWRFIHWTFKSTGVSTGLWRS